MRLVYFIQSKAREGLIKIGFSTNIKARLRSLRKERGDLRLLVASGTISESEVHAKFRHLRIAGSEWFKPGSDLLSYVKELQAERHGKLERGPGLTPFGEHLKEQKISYAEAGRVLEISRAYAHMLAHGKADPSITLRWKIEQWSKGAVTTEMWARI